MTYDELMKAGSKLRYDAKGRLILPEPSAFDPVHSPDAWTEAELLAVYAEALRRRTWWRLRYWPIAALIIAFLLVTFWLLPAASWEKFPFENWQPWLN